MKKICLVLSFIVCLLCFVGCKNNEQDVINPDVPDNTNQEQSGEVLPNEDEIINPGEEKPDENFYYVLKDLRGIATNVNQLARQANRYQYVDSNKFFAIADKISDFIIAIQETYLTPARKD